MEVTKTPQNARHITREQKGDGVFDVGVHPRPLTTALTMVAKLSSARIMAAASLTPQCQ